MTSPSPHCRPFDALLVANRGEIACRVLRTARAMGLRTVAIFSDADRDAPHVRAADVALRVGPPPAADSYLRIDAVLDAARAAGAQAVHPGYGFLSERAAFAQAVVDAGLVFVGPSAAAIRALGDKASAKSLARELGVPCLPGIERAADLDALERDGRRIGFPLMVKAAAGGGGRGMRRVDSPQALRSALEAAAAEAHAAFGSGELLLERLLEDARHVEVQVFGDAHGARVHLGERDCSTQRRHQKIIEEAPAPGVDAALRARMGEAAVRLAGAVGYVGAGTVEFLLEPDGNFHFLEMNTRLQVEHPVTEAVTGLDLVEWQLRVARGEPLPLAQGQVRWHGHAIEARLCAEDPDAGFAPQAGPVLAWQAPVGLRCDAGIDAGGTVPPHYDSMVAKLVAHGATREDARAALLAGLSRTVLLGVASNREHLCRVLSAAPFVEARLSTGWLESAALAAPASLPSWWLALAAAHLVDASARRYGPLAGFSSSGPREAPVSLAVRPGGSGSVGGAQLLVECRVARASPHGWRVRVATTTAAHQAPASEPSPGADRPPAEHEVAFGAADLVRIDGRALRCVARRDGEALWLQADGVCACIEVRTHAPPRSAAGGAADGELLAPMHGRVLRVACAPGQRVRAGDLLVALEAMKMEHAIAAPADATVDAVEVREGVQVAPGRLLVRLRPEAA